MAWQCFLAIVALVHLVHAYEVTIYSAVSSSTAGVYTFATTTETVFFNSTFEVSIAPTETPHVSIIEASTSFRSLVTIVEAFIEAGVGTEVTGNPRFDGPEFHVAVTFDNCYTHSNGRISWIDGPVTMTQSLMLDLDVTRLLTPTATVGTTGMIAPSDLHPIDLARASGEAVPDVLEETQCSRETTVVDYRSLCENWIVPSLSSVDAKATTTRTRERLSCGEMNPCCYGCRGWGPGIVFAQNVTFYVCEDGRELDLNGTVREGSELWEQSLVENSSSRGAASLFLGVAFCFVSFWVIF